MYYAFFPAPFFRCFCLPGVDIILGGHEHIYERYWPIYNFQVFIIHFNNIRSTTFNSIKVKNGSYEEPYTDPGAPVHIVTGAAVSDVGN